jgi:ABC-type transporter MlaC component
MTAAVKRVSPEVRPDTGGDDGFTPGRDPRDGTFGRKMSRRMRPVRCIAVFPLLAVAAGIPSPAQADEPRPPLDVVRDLVETIRAFEPAKDGEKLSPAREQKNAGVVEKAHAALDIEGLARRALGPTWRELKAPQRAELLRLLRRSFAEIAYPQSAKFFGKLDLEFEDAGARGDQHVVAVEVSHPDEGLIDLEFFLEKVEGRWKVVDLHLDMVSLALDIQSRMRGIVADDGFDELLRRMRSKLDEEGAPG